MFRKIANVLKEVFWIKSSRKRASPGVKKSTVKKKVAKKASKVFLKPKVPADPSLHEAGVITHYFDRIKVCVVKVTQGTILIGDKLTVIGPKTKFVQKVWSMQIESADVKVAKKGQLIGLKVDKIVREGDKVYK